MRNMNTLLRVLSPNWGDSWLARNAPECDPAHPHFIRTLDCCVLQLSIELLDHQLYGDEYQSVIISFLVIWGIDTKEEYFKDPRTYASDLSAIVRWSSSSWFSAVFKRSKMGRRTIREYHWRRCDHGLWRSKGGRWCLGSWAYVNMPKRWAICWPPKATSSDRTTKNGSRIKNFATAWLTSDHSLVSKVVKAQEELARFFLIDGGEKLENVVAPLRLVDIKDNPGKSRPAWNFLKDERNWHLLHGSNWMMDRITESPKLLHRFFQDPLRECDIGGHIMVYD